MLLLLAVWFACLRPAQGAESAWVSPGAGGALVHVRDAQGNRVPDFSNTGFREGVTAIPVVPVQATVSPGPGDDGDAIQAAIDQVSGLLPDAQGFRGAVWLAPGEYQVADHLRIQASGVVLRGAGSGTNGTILRATGSGQRTLVRVFGAGSRSNVVNTTRTILDTYVPVGARSFTVNNTNGYAVGDRVQVRRPSTQAWLEALGMHLLENPWTPGSRDIASDRVITRLEGNRVVLNAPLVCALDADYGGGTMQRYTWDARLRQVGIEHLRGVSDFTAPDDEDHGWIFIELRSCEDGWVRDVTSQHFGFACVALHSGALRVTVEDCQALDPVSQVAGGRRYAFVLDDAELCLVRNGYTRQDRHHFVTQSNTDGPNAFVDGVCDEARNDVGPHQRWATGALWDNITVNGHLLNIQNRGNLGTGHGWAGANCVAWNSAATGGFIVQNPPTARNWLVGSVGPIKTGTAFVGPHDPGTYDSHDTPVFPQSLYYAQLQDRLAAPWLEMREQVVGDFDLFNPTNGPAGSTPVDSNWLSQVAIAVGGPTRVAGFDNLAPRQWIAWTHTFGVNASERILSATLSLAVRATGGGWATNRICFDSLTDSRLITNYAAAVTTNSSTVLTLDLADRLSLLADGRLNLAVGRDLAVDWSVLEWRAAPGSAVLTNVLAPEADALVRGGEYADDNFGTGNKLTTKEDPAEDVRRRALLRWDLGGVAGRVVSAIVRLVPVTVNQTAVENAAAVADNNWTERDVTWNNQPAAGRRFASWQPRLNTPVEFAVTPQVEQALRSDRKLSLQVFSIRNFGPSGNIDYAAREHATAGWRPQLSLLISNSPPRLGAFEDRFLHTNTSTGPISFIVGDDETPSSTLAVTATSAPTAILPASGLVLGGSGANRSLTVNHAGTSTGLVNITVTVSDGAWSASQTWRLTVGPSNAPPFLPALSDRTIAEDETTGGIPFVIGDSQTPAEQLEVATTSSNANLVSDSDILLGGTGSNRTVTLTPRPNANGETRVTLRVSDGSLTATQVFTLVVQPVNDPPDYVALTEPVAGQRFTSEETVHLLAEATDPDGEPLRVHFLAGERFVADDTASPFHVAWSGPPPGIHALTAVATDAAGVMRTSAPVNILVEPAPIRLVPFGATWRYLDTGLAPPASWMEPDFHDSDWPAGAAELGYGDDDESTLVGQGAGATNRPITMWFRHGFEVPTEPALASLILRVIRDDGVVVHLNGREVFRNNLPAGAIGPDTLALVPVTGEAESRAISAGLPGSDLSDGWNVLAVEVHQVDAVSGDLSFDLELLGYPIEALPRLTVELASGGLILKWPAWAAAFALLESTGLGPDALWLPVHVPVLLTNGVAEVTMPVMATPRFFRLGSR